MLNVVDDIIFAAQDKMKRLVKEASDRQTTLERRLEIRKELTQLRRIKRRLVYTY
ncbi:hypothetical protein [Paenibacillus vini]|uniref:Uncharacterized protein n=1 Tax=Paenibacillus vini TaxID=1476024 RepID=A0ABQ4M886_9BACL|nr:hypothetical protein [Paenibacillus vini]GIP52198.1 hypothetical protein J42TS3_12330 [Paenibacillus vini]